MWDEDCYYKKKEFIKALVEWKNSDSKEAESLFKERRKEYRAQIEKSKKKCADKKIEELNKSKGLKEYWTVISKMRGKKKEGINEDIRDEQWLLHFNSSLGGSDERRICKMEKVDTLTEMKIKKEEIKRAISRLGRKKAPGEDGIVGEAWKVCEDIVEQKLSEIYEEIYKEDVIPKEWKKGVLTFSDLD